MSKPGWRVAIVGTATSSFDMAPWKNHAIEMWATTSICRHFPERAPRVDLWFEMHPEEIFEKAHRDWWDWALEKQPRVMMQDVHPRLSLSEKYPLEEMVSRFGRYFTSSIAYMLALAIDRRAASIDIYGVDMQAGHEYHHQRPCCEYLIGQARGLGIEVFVPEYSALVKADALYGYERMQAETPNEALMDQLAEYRARAIHYEKQLMSQRMRRRKGLGGKRKRAIR